MVNETCQLCYKTIIACLCITKPHTVRKKSRNDFLFIWPKGYTTKNIHSIYNLSLQLKTCKLTLYILPHYLGSKSRRGPQNSAQFERHTSISTTVTTSGVRAVLVHQPLTKFFFLLDTLSQVTILAVRMSARQNPLYHRYPTTLNRAAGVVTKQTFRPPSSN